VPAVAPAAASLGRDSRYSGLVAPDGRYATRRNVRLGRRNPEHVEVLDGLQTGEKVIVSGYEAFQKIERVEFEKPEHGSH